MDYKKAVAFHEETKMYGSILGLDSIRALMQELGDVWKKLKIVHIAGTNGKGSVCCFLASILKEAGYKVGQYNSPAVFDLREVYQINGKWISEESYAAYMGMVKNACECMVKKGLMHPTVFEVETAVAFLWFYQENCDIVLLETGMGGATDATNLIQDPLCSVLVSISMDHMQFLGDTLEEIAEIKSGIIKKKHPVITVKQAQCVKQILLRSAEQKQAEYRESEEINESWMKEDYLFYRHPKLGIVRLSQLGYYQVENSALAIEVILFLKKIGYSVTKEQILNGLEHAHWQGRFERLSLNPRFYIDGAHNVDAAIQLKQTLTKMYADMEMIGIMGVMEDKEYEKILDILLPVFTKIYTVTPDHPRALPAEKLACAVKQRGTEAIAEESVWQAVKQACGEAKDKNDTVMVLAFGTLYDLKEVKKSFYDITGDK